ncbi:MAG: efflux RND transporter periplasmic adaptor subunit, partial [Oscillospiraceae bacterium]|nr:efflux RND transporter periplasmic adaptor subunit [Oscillospiraceae bacterium]
SVLSHLLNGEVRQVDQGRLITGNDWYFVCLPPSPLALEEGGSLVLDLGLGEIPCLVQSLENSVAVFRMETQLVPHASLRIARGKIISERISGLALPSAALHQNGEEHYVWVIAAGRLEKKTINVIFFGEDFVLAGKTDHADALQEGDKVLTAGEDLYEGKIII